MTKLLALAVAAAAILAAAASPAGAASEVCPSFKQNGLTFKWETSGSKWTCANAKRWVVKLSRDRVHVAGANVPLANGPRGYHCFATPFSSGGRATGGTCFSGTLAFPKSGFSWFTVQR